MLANWEIDVFTSSLGKPEKLGNWEIGQRKTIQNEVWKNIMVNTREDLRDTEERVKKLLYI